MCLSCLFSEKSISLILFFLVFVSGLFQKIINPYLPQPTPSPTKIFYSTSSAQLVKVIKVIDGDTIEVENAPASVKATAGKQKVRYIGINAPELHDPKKPVQCFAQRAMEKNKELVEGKMVRLEKDVSETDKYGRLLRFVFLDNLFINQYLVAEGYAYATTFAPDVKYAAIFQEGQRSAKENKKGLWNNCP